MTRKRQQRRALVYQRACQIRKISKAAFNRGNILEEKLVHMYGHSSCQTEFHLIWKG